MKNRPIRFRVWDGQAMHFEGAVMIEQFPQIPLAPKEGKYFFFTFVGIESGEMICGSSIEEPVVMQFTGIKDKDGAEIFEGDILQFPTGIAKMVWEDAAWAVESPGSEAVDWLRTQEYAECRVIGNIFEHPSLFD